MYTYKCLFEALKLNQISTFKLKKFNLNQYFLLVRRMDLLATDKANVKINILRIKNITKSTLVKTYAAYLKLHNGIEIPQEMEYEINKLCYLICKPTASNPPASNPTAINPQELLTPRKLVRY